MLNPPAPWDDDEIIVPAAGAVPPPMPMATPAIRPLTAPQPKPVEPRKRNTTTVEGVVLDLDAPVPTPIYTAPPKPGEKTPVDPVLSGVIKGLGIDELLLGVQRTRRNLSGGWATGVKGQLGGMVMGSERNDFLGNLDSLKGAITMEKLQALKDASATGASGMGALSEKEGERLASAVSSLSERMSQSELETSMQVIERHALMLKAISDGKNPELPEVQAEYKIPPFPTIGAPGAEPEMVTNPNYGKHGTVDPETGALNVDIFEEPRLLPADQARVDARLAKTGTAADIVGGAVDTVTFGGGDELAAGADALVGSLSGKGSYADLYRGNIGVERAFADAQAERSPWAYGSGQLVGALAVPFGAGARGANALARVGGAQGAAYGFGAADGGLQSRVIGAGVGGATGYAAGGALGWAAPRVASALEPVLRPRGRAPDVIRLLDAENITPRGSLLPGRADRAAALEAKGGSGPIIREADAQTMGELEGRVSELSGGGTSLRETMLAGEKLQEAGARYITRSGQMANRIYGRARGLAGNARIIPNKAIKAVDDRLAILNENPSSNAGEIEFFTGIRNDLFQRRGKTVDGARQLRRSIRGTINKDNLTATEAEAEAMKVMDALREDARDSLPNGAGQAFELADRFYAERMQEIETVANKFIGPRSQPISGETAFAKFRAMATNKAGGDGRRLAAVWRNLDPEEQRDLAATFVERIGRTGDSPTAPFSAALFVSQATQGLSPSARRTMFGPAGARSIENLIELSRQLTSVQRRQNNSSTSRVTANDVGRGLAKAASPVAIVGGTTQSLGASATAVAVTAGAMLAARMVRSLSARALMSPSLTRWLADAPSVQSAAQTRRHAERLGNIMAREPALAAELTGFHRMMMLDVTPRAVASEPEEQRRDR